MAEAVPSSDNQSTSILVMGMAGSGKTAFVQALTHHLTVNNQLPYCINLDPAVHHVPYPTSIDIRDTVKYKEVMKLYGLGPNGGIMTSLNLFSTKFDQVLSLIQNKTSQHKYFIFDTPGQIEVFTWSASGMIITEALSTAMRTVVVYVMDTPRSHSPTTFMSNMLYACSILYKTRLPFIVLLNKTDIIDCDFALEWMRDFETFQEALKSSNEEHDDSSSYMSSFNQSMSLILDEFYTDLMACGVSSVTGDGMSDFMSLLYKAEKEFDEVFKPEQIKLAEKKKQDEKKTKIQPEPSTSTAKFNDNEEDTQVSADMFIGRARCAADDKHDSDDEEEEEEPMEADSEESKDSNLSFQNFIELHKRGRFVDKLKPQLKPMD